MPGPALSSRPWRYSDSSQSLLRRSCLGENETHTPIPGSVCCQGRLPPSLGLHSTDGALLEGGPWRVDRTVTVTVWDVPAEGAA